MANPNHNNGSHINGRRGDDPTENVKDLMSASLDALAKLRKADKELSTCKAAHQKEIASLRAEHQKELRANDTERYSAIRQVDITNATSAAAETQRAIQALAKTTEDTRKTLADQMANRDARVDERLSGLERVQNLGEGKQRVADPIMAEIAAEMKAVNTALASGGGMVKGLSTAWLVVIGGIGALGTLFGIAGLAVAVVIYLTKGAS